MSSSIGLGPPSVGDRRCIREARREAHRQIDAINDARAAALREAFRVELGTTIRSVSPFLQFLLKIEGLSLDEIVSGIVPARGWRADPGCRRVA